MIQEAAMNPKCAVRSQLSDCTALLLVGGLGTRLRSVYADGPKAMAPVAGKPFLGYLLHMLADAGIQRVVLCVGYRAEQIQEWLGDGSKFGVDVRYSLETEPMGTAGALGLAYARHARGERVLAMNGDSIVQMSLPAMSDWHTESRAEATIALVEVSNASRYGRVETDERGWVKSFREKSEQQAKGLINGGVYMFEPSVMEHIVESQAVSLEREVLPAQISRGLLAFQTDGYFIDIGIPDDFVRAQTELAPVVKA